MSTSRIYSKNSASADEGLSPEMRGDIRFLRYTKAKRAARETEMARIETPARILKADSMRVLCEICQELRGPTSPADSRHLAVQVERVTLTD